MNRHIEATILTGVVKGEDGLIPRFIPILADVTFQFRRAQFRVQLSLAIFINKAQGQSLQDAGLHLIYPCFSCGQLYVACSRVGSPKNLYVYAPNGSTNNVVYPEVLTG